MWITLILVIVCISVCIIVCQYHTDMMMILCVSHSQSRQCVRVCEYVSCVRNRSRTQADVTRVKQKQTITYIATGIHSSSIFTIILIVNIRRDTGRPFFIERVTNSELLIVIIS